MQDITKEYYSSNVKQWLSDVYAEPLSLGKFPFGAARQLVLKKCIQELDIKPSSVLDIGCGGGELSLLLAGMGFEVMGLDFSLPMIKEAEEKLRIQKINSSIEFKFGNFLEINLEKVFEMQISMGVIEYINEPELFFAQCTKHLCVKGYLLLEFSNRLFNTLSANQFALKELAQGNMDELIHELQNWLEEIKFEQKHYIEYIGAMQVSDDLNNEIAERKEPFRPFPVARIQHTLSQIKNIAKENGLIFKKVYGLHPHPFLPALENKSPLMFNRIAWNLQQMPENPLVLLSCSSLAAIFEKEN